MPDPHATPQHPIGMVRPDGHLKLNLFEIQNMIRQLQRAETMLLERHDLSKIAMELGNGRLVCYACRDREGWK